MIKKIKKVVKLGNYTKSNYESSLIVHKKGIAPTIKENHGTVLAVIIKYEK